MSVLAAMVKDSANAITDFMVALGTSSKEQAKDRAFRDRPTPEDRPAAEAQPERYRSIPKPTPADWSSLLKAPPIENEARSPTDFE